MRDKLENCKSTIMALMESSAPCTMSDIVRECREQSYAGMIPLALRDLLNTGAITIDNDDVFDLNGE